MEYWGNRQLLELDKTAFLCSQRFPASAVLKSYDWAKAQRAAGAGVVCGNHSQIERDVFDILLKGTQPLILVLARGMKKRWPPEVAAAVRAERLLVVSPFPASVTRVTRETAAVRNREIVALTDRVVVGYVGKGGMVEGVVGSKNHIIL
jgi:predicted Rossmann fold nucleotide-binding protein DprA/Smf involved in DNA uptake